MAAIDPNAPSAAPRKAAELLPTGPYLCSIKWAEKTVSNKGSERVTFTFEIVAGDHKGKSHREDCYLSAGAVFKIQTLAKAAGVKKAFDPDKSKELIDLFVGKQLKIVLAADNWTDATGAERETRKVSVFESLDPDTKKAMDAERQARFPKTGSSSVGAPAVTTDEEIPF